MAVEDYITLMASLPALGPVLAARQVPINRARLDARLGLLAPEHRAELDRLYRLLAWRRLPLDGTDAAFVAEAERVIPTLSRPVLRGLARDRLELRTAVAALRRRHRGEDAPPPGTRWGYGRFVERIRKNWQEPAFGLARPFPWLPAAREALEKGQSSALERILLEEAWRQAERRTLGHDFDFEAVALYAIRWNLLERWTRYDAQAASDRFSRLVADALATAPGLPGPSQESTA